MRIIPLFFSYLSILDCEKNIKENFLLFLISEILH